MNGRKNQKVSIFQEGDHTVLSGDIENIMEEIRKIQKRTGQNVSFRHVGTKRRDTKCFLINGTEQ